MTSGLPISASVGRGGVNAPQDVAAIQQALNARVGDLGLGALRSDGTMDEPTMSAIGRYQSFVMGEASSGRITPNSAILDRLSDTSPTTLMRERLAAQAVQRNLSGAAWFRANEARFPNSDRISDLTPAFAVQVDSFVSMLKRASATVRVSSTRRNRNRAWLMHYAWEVAHGQIKPDAVPANKDVDIHWDHGDARTSRKAAQAMVNLFHIKFKPSLTSNHIDGTAIDMTISWDQAISVTDASGKSISIDQPRSGNSNDDLHKVGATYGVRKLATDPPHWSADGH